MSQDYNPTPATDLLSAMARLNIQDLAQPVMIDLEVEVEDGQVLRFSVMQPYLCAYSRYFRFLFKGPWADSGKRTIKIDDLEFIHPWVIPCVIAWMYTQTLSLRGIYGSLMEFVSEEVDLDDFTTWSYRMLWALYSFADRYEIKALRTIIIRQVQLKMVRCRSGIPYTVDWSGLLTVADLEALVKEIPISESPLRKAIAWMWAELEFTSRPEDLPRDIPYEKVKSFWFVDMGIVWRLRQLESCEDCSFATDYTNYPLPDGYQLSCQLHSEDVFRMFNEGDCPRTWCISFHEHDTAEEALSCQKFMEAQTGEAAQLSRTDGAKNMADFFGRYR